MLMVRSSTTISTLWTIVVTVCFVCISFALAVVLSYSKEVNVILIDLISWGGYKGHLGAISGCDEVKVKKNESDKNVYCLIS